LNTSLVSPSRGDLSPPEAAVSERFNWRAHLKVHPAADLFPLMSQDELKALAEDIKTNGLQQPIILWRESSTDAPVLDDGRNRLDALASLGWLGPPRERAPREPIKKYKRRVQLSPLWIGDDEDECCVIPEQCFQIAGGDPYDLALSLNIQRRHLSAEQKRELIAKMLKAKPESSDRSIAEPLRVDHKTVGAVRHDLEDRGEIPHHDKRTDSRGRQQPAKKKPALADDNAESSAQARKDHYAADVEAEEDFEIPDKESFIERAKAASELSRAFEGGVIDDEMQEAAGHAADAWAKYAGNNTKWKTQWSAYVEASGRLHKQEARNNTLLEALQAKEAKDGRNWPAEMTPKQLKRHQKILACIAWWQRDLERLYGEVTGSPSWRVEILFEDGKRLGNGLRFGTRNEAEAYREATYKKEIEEPKLKGHCELIPCLDKPNVETHGNSIYFDHGGCVLFDWRPIAETAAGDAT
jgi:hypothetical protein